MLKERISWNEWKAQWASATDVPARVGLLHSSFEATTLITEHAECICFLLQAAEMTERQYSHAESDPVSDKALTVLTQKFFKYYDDVENGVAKLHYFPPSVLEAVCHFFRLSPKDCYHTGTQRFQNISTVRHLSKNIRESLQKFIEDFARYLWDGTGFSTNTYRASGIDLQTFKLFKEKRLFALEILTSLCNRKLEQVIPSEWSATYIDARKDLYTTWKRFDIDALVKLEELALREGKTVEDALVNGSSPARVLLVVRIAQKQIELQEKIDAAKEKIAAGQREFASVHN